MNIRGRAAIAALLLALSSVAPGRCASQAPLPCEYSITVPVPHHCELWVLLEHVSADSITCHYDGDEFVVGGVDMTPGRDSLQNWEKNLPWAKELLVQGYSESQVRHQIRRELNCLGASVQKAYATAGKAGVDSVLRSSALVDSVALGETYATYWIRGIPDLRVDYKESPCTPRLHRYEQFGERLRTVLQGLPTAKESLVLITDEDVWSISGVPEMDAARAQILHVIQFQSVNTLPSGPFRMDAPELYSVLKAARMASDSRPNRPYLDSSRKGH